MDAREAHLTGIAITRGYPVHRVIYGGYRYLRGYIGPIAENQMEKMVNNMQ